MSSRHETDDFLITITSNDSFSAIKGLDIFPPIKKRNIPLLLRLTKRTVVFLSITTCSLITFYAAGNYQNFLDSNLKFLISMITFTSLALLILSLVATVESILFLIKTKWKRLFSYLISFFLLSVFSTAIFIIAMSLNMLSEGINF